MDNQTRPRQERHIGVRVREVHRGPRCASRHADEVLRHKTVDIFLMKYGENTTLRGGRNNLRSFNGFFVSPHARPPRSTFRRRLDRDGNGYPSPAYPPSKYPLDIRVWDKKLPMGIQMGKIYTHRVERVWV
jgi:hypothetical protein